MPRSFSDATRTNVASMLYRVAHSAAESTAKPHDLVLANHRDPPFLRLALYWYAANVYRNEGHTFEGKAIPALYFLSRSAVNTEDCSLSRFDVPRAPTQ
jgi:hypothetical protein